jgi:hypothetical protein
MVVGVAVLHGQIEKRQQRCPPHNASSERGPDELGGKSQRSVVPVATACRKSAKTWPRVGVPGCRPGTLESGPDRATPPQVIARRPVRNGPSVSVIRAARVKVTPATVIGTTWSYMCSPTLPEDAHDREAVPFVPRRRGTRAGSSVTKTHRARGNKVLQETTRHGHNERLVGVLLSSGTTFIHDSGGEVKKKPRENACRGACVEVSSTGASNCDFRKNSPGRCRNGAARFT